MYIISDYSVVVGLLFYVPPTVCGALCFCVCFNVRCYVSF